MENMSVYGAIKKRKSAKTCKGHKLHTRQKQTVKQNTTLNSGSQNRDIVVVAMEHSDLMIVHKSY